MTETMVEFRLAASQANRVGEVVLLRVSQIMALFPEHRHIRTVGHGWTLTVCDEDWGKVESGNSDSLTTQTAIRS